MIRLSGIFTVMLIALTIFSLSCSDKNRSDVPDPAVSDGKGDATNTLRYQNRSVK